MDDGNDIKINDEVDDGIDINLVSCESYVIKTLDRDVQKKLLKKKQKHAKYKNWKAQCSLNKMFTCVVIFEN